MEYNQYPEKISPDGKIEWTTRPKQLKKNEKVEYELLNIGPSPLDKTGKTLAIPEIYGVKKKDTVFIPFPDKFKKELKAEGDHREGEYVDIAFMPGNRSEGIFFTRKSGGTLTVTGGKARDQALFEFLETCNANASNPNRDRMAPKIFQRVDHKARNQRAREERKERLRAVEKAEKLKTNELYRVAIGLGYQNPNRMDEESLRNTIESYAEHHPLEFLMKVENPDLVIQEIASNAKDKGFVKVDMQKRSIIANNGETLYTWAPEKDVKWTEKFVEFVKSEDGEKFYSALKQEMKVNG